MGTFFAEAFFATPLAALDGFVTRGDLVAGGGLVALLVLGTLGDLGGEDVPAAGGVLEVFFVMRPAMVEMRSAG